MLKFTKISGNLRIYSKSLLLTFPSIRKQCKRLKIDYGQKHESAREFASNLIKEYEAKIGKITSVVTKKEANSKSGIKMC